MTPRLSTLGSVISLGLAIVLATSQLGAAPKFSGWAAPMNLGPIVNSPFDDFGAAISKDGLSLYFTSSRPVGSLGGIDIWVTQRATRNDAWGPPANLGAAVNTAASDNVPALSRDGHWLFFNSTRPGFGGQDIWASWREHVHDDFGWQPAFNLGEGVNSTFVDANPSYLENDEGGAPLLFFTSNRPGGPGGFDVYVSQLGADGTFGPATLVPELSSPAAEQRPSVRFDGLELFFHSDRPGSAGNDLWVSARESVFDPWSTPVNLGATVNTAFSDQQPYIAADRRTLYMVSNRPGGTGGFDLYVTTRAKTGP